MAAAVVRIALALYQPPLLEVVEDVDELAAVEGEHVGDRRLRLRGALTEGRKDAVLVHAGAGPLEFVDHASLDREAEPCQQEHRAGKELFREARRPSFEVWNGC